VYRVVYTWRGPNLIRRISAQKADAGSREQGAVLLLDAIDASFND
jgi:hypothetical protein